jgi:hypothetical protein
MLFFERDRVEHITMMNMTMGVQRSVSKMPNSMSMFRAVSFGISIKTPCSHRSSYEVVENVCVACPLALYNALKSCVLSKVTGFRDRVLRE